MTDNPRITAALETLIVALHCKAIRISTKTAAAENAMVHDRRNEAIGTLAEVDSAIAEIEPLYQTILALHRESR